MAVKIRLTRMGSKKKPFYRIVATNSETRRDGRPLEFLGHYNPMVEPAQVEVDTERLKVWTDRGAEVSESVRTLLKRFGK